MKFLLWQITFEPYRLAKVQWILFRLFDVKPKDPCGHTKSNCGQFCHQPFDVKRCDVINDGKDHRVVCKCCGSARILSNRYIKPNPNNYSEWFGFDDEVIF